MRAKLVLLMLCLAPPALASAGGQFATEYINDLSNIEIARGKAETDLGNTTNEKLMSCIRGGTSQQLELNRAARNLRKMDLPGEMKGTPALIADAFEARSKVFGEIVKNCQLFVAGPKPGVDYGQLAAEAPKLSAKLDFIDKTIFQGSPIVPLALIDATPDAQGKLSRLNITCKERDDLIHLIEISFKDLNKKEPNYIVGSAKIVRDWLKSSGHSCAK